MNKELIYIATIRYPTEKAHGVQITHMCRAFALQGYDVTLVVPKRKNAIVQDAASYYGVSTDFRIRYLPAFDMLAFAPWLGKVAFLVHAFFFVLLARLYVLRRPHALVYSRDWFVGLVTRRVVLELHTLPKKFGRLRRWVYGRVKKIVVLTAHVQREFSKVGIADVLVAPDAVDLTMFDQTLTRDAARKALSLPTDVRLVGYVGMFRTLGMDKGVGLLMEMIGQLPDDVRLLLVGGTPADIDVYTAQAQELGVLDRVLFVGRVPHTTVPTYLAACDVLVAPFPDHPHYRYAMSPMKLFEYMAAKRPMVVSDLPSLRDILDESMAVFFAPGSIEGLVRSVSSVLNEGEKSATMAMHAYRAVQTHSWEHRALRIVSHID